MARTVVGALVAGFLLVPAAVPAGAQDLDNGQRLFRACAFCHSLAPDGPRRAGPSLYGLFGRRAGTVEGYRYSPALRDSTIVWTEDTVARLFEVGPEAMTPGSKMPPQLLPSSADRADLVAYLKEATAVR